MFYHPRSNLSCNKKFARFLLLGGKTRNIAIQLVCFATLQQNEAMLRVLPPTFEPVLQQIRLQGFYYWVVKRATSLFNSFGAKSQAKLRVFAARFMLYLNFKVTFCRQAQGKAPHSYSRWLHLIEPQERTASALFI